MMNLKLSRFVVGLGSSGSATCILDCALTYGDKMFCPACGDQSTEGLRYCKRCGASFGAPDDLQTRKFPTPLIALFLVIIALITMVGLALPLSATESLTRTFSTHDIMIILFGSWTLTLLIDAMLVWLLFMLIGLSQQFTSRLQKERSFAGGRTPEAISAAPQSIGSVTENTTRSFKLPRYEDSTE